MQITGREDEIMSFADSLRENTRKKELDAFAMKKAIESCHQRIRSYCESHSDEGKAEGYLLGAVKTGITSLSEESGVQVYPSQYEAGSVRNRLSLEGWLNALYTGKTET